MPVDNDDEQDDIRNSLEAAFEADANGTLDTNEKRETPETPKTEVPAEKKVDPVAGKTPDQAKKDDEPADKEKKPDPAKPSYRAPPSKWSKEQKEAWAKAFGELDPENPTHKQIGSLRDMMHDFHSNMEQEIGAKVKEVEQRYSGIEAVIGPRRAAIEQGGGTVERALADLLQLNDYATQNPIEFVRWFVGARKLDPAQLFPPQSGKQPAVPGGNPEDDDPLDIIPKRYKDALALVPQLQQQLQQLQGNFGHVAQTVQTAQQHATAQQQSAAVSHLQQWVTAQDSDGNALRPYYDDVKAEMITLLEKGIARDLDDAYERATWGNKGVRERIQADTQARSVAKREAEERAKADRAAAAAAGGTSGRAPVRVTPQQDQQSGGDSIMDDLMSAWSQVENGRR